MTVHWFGVRPDGNNVADSQNGVYPHFEREYAFSEANNAYSLIVLGAESDDAGQYMCNSLVHTSSAYAEIIMLGNLIFYKCFKNGTGF